MSRIESLESRRLLSSNLIADFGGIYPTDSVTLNGVSYFAADDGVHGKELWKSDGTPGGAAMVRDFTPGIGSTEFDGMFAVGGRLLLMAATDRGGSLALWSSDGTTAGTVRLCHAGVNRRDSAVVLGDQLIFNVAGGPNESQICVSDGTAAGTRAIHNFPLDPERSADFRLYKVGQRVVFTTVTTISGGSIWSTDGTTAGTVELTFAPGAGMKGLQVSHPVVSHELLYFINTNLEQIWRTDGTLDGTQIIMPDIGSGDATGMREAGGKVYFTVNATYSNAGSPEVFSVYELWTTDGTQAGTIRLAVLKHMWGTDLGEIGDQVLFGGSSAVGSNDLWVTDGTLAGTRSIRNFPGDWASGPALFRSVRGVSFFQAGDLQHGIELWRSDGTSAGTALVQDITPGPDSTDFANMAIVDQRLVVPTPSGTLLFDPSTFAPGIGPAQAQTNLLDGVLRVFGTRDADSIRLYDMPDNPDRFVVSINGVKRSYGFSAVSRIYIYGYSGDDNIAVLEKYGKFTVRSRIWSGDGDDQIYGGGSRDTIFGEAGNDSINSGNNDDQLSGGVGDDSITSGNGNDTASGDDGSDTVYGNKGDDCIGGGDDQGSDHLDGGSGADVIFGNAVYEIFYNGKAGDDPGGLDDVLLS